MEAVRRAWAGITWGGGNGRSNLGGTGYSVDDESRGTSTRGLTSKCDGRAKSGFRLSRRCRRNVPQVCAPSPLTSFCVPSFFFFPCLLSRVSLFNTWATNFQDERRKVFVYAYQIITSRCFLLSSPRNAWMDVTLLESVSPPSPTSAWSQHPPHHPLSPFPLEIRPAKKNI